jgi:hypothetical protein
MVYIIKINFLPILLKRFGAARLIPTPVKENQQDRQEG